MGRPLASQNSTNRSGSVGLTGPSIPESGIGGPSSGRSVSTRWLSIIIRPSGAGRDATSRPWERRVGTAPTVPEAYPPRPFVSSHSRASRAGTARRRSCWLRHQDDGRVPREVETLVALDRGGPPATVARVLAGPE